VNFELTYLYNKLDNPELQWFEKSVENKEVLYYDHQDFNNKCNVGSGGSSSVYVVDWKDTKYAIKRFKNFSKIMNDVKNEVF